MTPAYPVSDRVWTFVFFGFFCGIRSSIRAPSDVVAKATSVWTPLIVKMLVTCRAVTASKPLPILTGFLYLQLAVAELVEGPLLEHATVDRVRVVAVALREQVWLEVALGERGGRLEPGDPAGLLLRDRHLARDAVLRDGVELEHPASGLRQLRVEVAPGRDREAELGLAPHGVRDLAVLEGVVADVLVGLGPDQAGIAGELCPVGARRTVDRHRSGRCDEREGGGRDGECSEDGTTHGGAPRCGGRRRHRTSAKGSRDGSGRPRVSAARPAPVVRRTSDGARRRRGARCDSEAATLVGWRPPGLGAGATDVLLSAGRTAPARRRTGPMPGSWRWRLRIRQSRR